VVKLDRCLKIFFTALAITMLVAGTMTSAMAVSSKAYSFEDNLEVALPNVAYEELYVPGEILVKFSPGVSETKINAMNSKNEATVTYTSPHAGFKILKIPKTKSVEEMVEIYSKNPNVEYATANYIMHSTMIPDDEYYNEQWNFNSQYGINVEQAWDTSTGDGVIVAVIDTGIAQNVPDLEGADFASGYDFINDDTDPTDDNGHGTHVAGTIAQSTNNDIGVAGIAYDCTLMPVKVLGSDGSGSLSALINGIYYAIDHDAQIISMSLGFSPKLNPKYFTSLDIALNDAYNAGIVIVAAAGNDGMAKIGYPAVYDKCIAVGATRYDGTRSWYSNYGSDLDVMAPGGDTSVDQNNDGQPDGIKQNTLSNPITGEPRYPLYQGTSMATPHVSGVAALLIASGVNGPDNVRAAIENSAQDIYSTGWDFDSGYGIIDAYAALNYFSTEDPTPSNTQPIADAGGPYTGTEDVAITFDGSASSDSDGDTLTYTWSFGDGSTASGVSPSHIYTNDGTYAITLIVNDGIMDSQPSGTTATISSANNPSSIYVNIDEMKYTTRNAGPNIFVTANAKILVTDGNGGILDGATVNGHWDGATSDLDIGTTTSDGTVMLYSDEVKYKGKVLSFDFTVDSVTNGGITYDSTDFGTVTNEVRYP
jgi:serine protease